MRTLREELLDLEEATMMTTNELTPYDIIEQMDEDEDMEALVLEINNTSSNLSKLTEMANQLDSIDFESIDGVELGRTIFGMESMAEELGVDITDSEEDKPGLLKRMKDAVVKAINYLLGKLKDLWKRFKGLWQKKAVKDAINTIDHSKMKEKETLDLSGINKYSALFNICKAGNIDPFANNCKEIVDFISGLNDLGKHGKMDKAALDGNLTAADDKLIAISGFKHISVGIIPVNGELPTMVNINSRNAKSSVEDWFKSTYKGKMIDVYTSITSNITNIFEATEKEIDSVADKIEKMKGLMKNDGKLSLKEFGLVDKLESKEASVDNNKKILAAIGVLGNTIYTGLMSLPKELSEIAMIVKKNIEDK